MNEIPLNKLSRMILAHQMLLVAFVLSACGTWAGNPKKDDTDSPSSGNIIAGAGEVLMQKLNLQAAANFKVKYSLSSSASLALADIKGFEASTSKSAFEVSIFDSEGKEVKYDRTSVDGVEASFSPEKDGDYYVSVKNNATDKVEVKDVTVEDANSDGGVFKSIDRADSAFKDFTLKAVVSFARNCIQNKADGSSTDSYAAGSGQYYAQPFVFLGKIGADGKASLVNSATIKLIYKDQELPLKKLSDIDYDNFREYSSLSKDQHVVFTRTFYQGYFGAAGEMYTVDYFKKGKSGGCESAPKFALGDDVGSQTIELSVKDGANGIDETIPVRATFTPAVSFYMGDGSKVSDWTQCTYNRTTGEPTTYNGTASACKEFSLKASPFVALDYKLGSEVGQGTKLSDPTRVIFYGHSIAKSWYSAAIPAYSALAGGSQDTVTLSGCLNNGGLVAVPINAEKTAVPLGEFNTSVGDVINVARSTGSYTALLNFYQGNVDASGTIDYSTCLSDGSSSCSTFKTIKVKQQSCTIKADSGITVLGVSDAFIYPDYFSISGIIRE